MKKEDNKQKQMCSKACVGVWLKERKGATGRSRMKTAVSDHHRKWKREGAAGKQMSGQCKKSSKYTLQREKSVAAGDECGSSSLRRRRR